MDSKFKETLLEIIFFVCAFVSVAGLLLIFTFVCVKGLPLFSKVSLREFLLGLDWSPTKGKFGALPFIVGSFLVTIGALLIGTPFALGTAIFLSEVASKKVKSIVKPAIELLAGIPSVIYGFFGIVVLVPLVRNIFGGSGFGLLTASLILALMILPTIATISEDVLSAVPKSFRQASFALGATQWQTITRVVLPAARSGIVNAVVLGMGRAIGETMAVLMVIGNAPIIPSSIKDPLSTLTSIIILDMPYASGEHQTALFAMGVVLLIISTSLVALIRFASTYRERV